MRTQRCNTHLVCVVQLVSHCTTTRASIHCRCQLAHSYTVTDGLAISTATLELPHSLIRTLGACIILVPSILIPTTLFVNLLSSPSPLHNMAAAVDQPLSVQSPSSSSTPQDQLTPMSQLISASKRNTSAAHDSDTDSEHSNSPRSTSTKQRKRKSSTPLPADSDSDDVSSTTAPTSAASKRKASAAAKSRSKKAAAASAMSPSADDDGGMDPSPGSSSASKPANRYDSSLGLLTKKFVSLLREACESHPAAALRLRVAAAVAVRTLGRWI